MQVSGLVTTGVGAIAAVGMLGGFGVPKANTCPLNAGFVAEGAAGPVGGNVQIGTDGMQAGTGIPTGRYGYG